jgi:CoA:oxalate CoA-transferase
VFLRLVRSADVVIENFRPGVMARLGLAYDALREVRSGLVYCAVSGFGQDGPLKDNPAYDQIVQGLAGVMSVTGDAASAPLRVGYPVADTIGGLTAAFAIAAALVRRSRTGEGEFIDVSMLETTLVTMGWQVSNWLIAGVRPQALGNENMTAAPSGLFATAAGPLNIAANQQQQFVTLTRLIGRPELAADPRFAEREARKRNRFALKAEIEAALAAKPAAEWAARFNANGVPAGEVLGIPEMLAHPQVTGRGLVKTFATAPGIPDFAGTSAAPGSLGSPDPADPSLPLGAAATSSTRGTPGTRRPVAVVRAGFRLASGDPAPAMPPPVLGADRRGARRTRLQGCRDRGAAPSQGDLNAMPSQKDMPHLKSPF